jgi:hypothetical protein
MGRASLEVLNESVDRQSSASGLMHLLLWDDFRAPGARAPESYDAPHRYNIVSAAALYRETTQYDDDRLTAVFRSYCSGE